MITKIQKIFLSSEGRYKKANNLIKQASQLAKNKNYPLAIKKIEYALKLEDRIEWADKLANYYYKSGNIEKADQILIEFKEKGKGDPLNQFGYDLWYLERKRIWEKNLEKKQNFEMAIEIKRLMTMAMFGENFSLDISFPTSNTLQDYFRKTIKSLEPDLHYIRRKYLESEEYHYKYCLERELERFEYTNDFVWYSYENDELAMKAIENFKTVNTNLKTMI